VVDEQGYTLHQVEDKGLVKSVKTTDYQQQTIDNKDKDDQMIVVFNINLKGEEGKALLRQVENQEAKVCLYLSADNPSAEMAKQRDGVLTSADWILLNDNQRNTLVEELESVLNHGKRISPKIANRLIKFISQPHFRHWDAASALTIREAEIMNLLVDGYLYKEVAQKLGISQQTVKSHLKHIYTKLHVTNRAEAMMAYIRHSDSIDNG
jgi:DNA-binding NarL/FixJ family response regulator